MYTKSLLKESSVYENACIAKDLTPLRARLLNYVKEECDGKFIKFRTINGNIRIMEAECGHINAGKNKWLIVKLPDDLFHLGIDIDFRKLNYKNAFKIIKMLLNKMLLIINSVHHCDD